MVEKTDQGPQIVDKQKCPMCGKNELTLMEDKREIPYFGEVFLFSMNCTNCKYHQADVESAEDKPPCKIELDVTTEEDMKIRVVKSGSATVKIPHVITITPGVAANGYISNVEGILTRVKNIVEGTKESDEDPVAKKKAKNMLKKLQKVMWGQEKLKIIIEDPNGNSAIISDKAKVTKLKK